MAEALRAPAAADSRAARRCELAAGMMASRAPCSTKTASPRPTAASSSLNALPLPWLLLSVLLLLLPALLLPPLLPSAEDLAAEASARAAAVKRVSPTLQPRHKEGQR